MKNLDSYITEKLVVGKNIIHKKIKVSTKYELRSILEERLAKDKNADLNDLDVSEITDMGNKGFIYWHGLFYNLDPHDIKIDKWDVSKVTNMDCMFCECNNFTGKGLENWDVSKVTNMNSTFAGCTKFNCDLSNWNVSNVKDIAFMFNRCENFIGKGLENWDVSKVENMYCIFYRCDSLKNKPSWYKDGKLN